MANSSVHSGTVNSLYRSRKVLLEYLKNQDYNIDDYDDFSINEVNSMISNNQLDMLVEKTNDDDKEDTKTEAETSTQSDTGTPSKAYIKYHLKKSLRPQYIDDCIEDLYNLEQLLKKNDTLIIVSKDEPNESLITHLKQIYSDDKYYIVIFSIKRLQFNILNHMLIPNHSKLTSNEAIQMKQKYNITDNAQLPEISRFDPVALAIGLRPGEVCHIQRPSKTAIYGDYYRYCLNK